MPSWLTWRKLKRMLLAAVAGGCLLTLLYWGLKLLALYYIYSVVAAWATQGAFPSFLQCLWVGVLFLFVFGRVQLGTINISLGKFHIDVLHLLAPLTAKFTSGVQSPDE